MRRGFTLIELAIAIALMATLLTIAYPSFADMLARHRLQAAAEALQADMADARLLAAQRAQPTFVGFNALGGAWCWAVTTASGCDCAVPQACRTRATHDAQHRGVQIIAAHEASFDADGRGQGFAELQSSRGHVLRVEVSPMGRSRVCEPGGVNPRIPAC